jgi:hemerythrin-like domain-containing protein
MRQKSSTTVHAADGPSAAQKDTGTAAPASVKRHAAPDVVGALYAEHRYAAQLLDLLDQQLVEVARGKPLDREASLSVMTYMTQHPDAYHHPREDAMFARLVKRDPHLKTRIDDIQRAHASIGSAGRKLRALLEGHAKDDFAEHDVVVPIRDYVSAMREHMAIEERDLFPRARDLLDEHDLAEVDRAFKRVVDPIFEQSVRDAYAAYSPVVRYLAERPAVEQALNLLDNIFDSAMTLGQTLFGATGSSPSAQEPTREEGTRRRAPRR